MTEDRLHDVVLFGATGFTGGLIAEVLTRRVGGRLRCALAGRDRAKLEAVRARLGPAGAEFGLIVADSNDGASLRAMARSAKVVITTVGPYTRYGEPLIAMCIEEGCDYVDLTGETHWWREMVERYHEPAAARGVLIIPSCGYDCIPADMGALFCAEQLVARHPRQASDQALTIDAYARGFGSFSGGTLASAMEIMAASGLGEPFGERSGDRAPLVHYARDVGRWAVRTFVLDPWVVRRSAELRPQEFGGSLRYQQYFAFPSRVAAYAAVGFGASLAAVTKLGPARTLLTKLRPSGSGPSPSQIARGWFRIDFVGRWTGGSTGPRRALGSTERGTGRELRTHVRGGDPGYGETSKMISEAAIMLVEARDQLPMRGGVVTTAAGLGREFIPRLEAAGLEFAVDP
jgi:short subunit dehydrogenase-like uncharacterized protein